MGAVVIQPSNDAGIPALVTFDLGGLRRLFEELVHRGYDVVGPGIGDGTIDLLPLNGIDDLPLGWTDEQAPGRYRLIRRGDEARFGFAVGPSSAKRMLHPPREPVWTMRRSAEGNLEVEMHDPEPTPVAFFGIRPCELAAIRTQDRVLAHGDNADRGYRSRRANTFIVAVNCGDPADTCFCSSMGTGPFAELDAGADVVLTEVLTPHGPHYTGAAATELGADVLNAVGAGAATEADRSAALTVEQRAEDRINRHLDASQLHDQLFTHLESPQWAAVGERCLSCGNCTLVCPTCFCTTPEDVTDLTGDVATRTQVWDTCFSATFSQLGHAPVRASIGSRYRQWATHKLASWIDQFGQSGCVGCGRCITWCPVGIDLTEEANRMLAGEMS